MIFKFFNSVLQNSYGFPFLLGKKIYGVTKSTLNLAFKKISIVLPFLSIDDLLTWTKKLSNNFDSIYDKAMDAEYIKSHIGGPYHRLFDGGHSPVKAWEKVKNASETDSFSQEVVGYVLGIWKDATTKMGMPFKTIDKGFFDHTAEVLNSSYGVKKSWLNDLLTWDVIELFSTVLGAAGTIFFLKKNDMKKVSEILGSMGIISILAANKLMGIVVIVQTVWAYVVKKKKLDGPTAIKGAGLSIISWAIFSILGLPILIELVIVIAIFKLVKKDRSKVKQFPKLLLSKLS